MNIFCTNCNFRWRVTIYFCVLTNRFQQRHLVATFCNHLQAKWRNPPKFPNNLVKGKCHLIVVVFLLFGMVYLVFGAIQLSMTRIVSCPPLCIAMHSVLMDSQTMPAPVSKMIASWNTCGDSVHVLT